MTERDRLAADLHTDLDDLLCRVFESDDVPPHHDMPPAFWLGMADRLIDLGWTRLDEERLARALHAATGWGDGISMPAEEYAAAIAKAYREDTDGAG